MSDNDGAGSDADENRERREAEFEFVRAAYSPEEARVVTGSSPSSPGRIHRRLGLPVARTAGGAATPSSGTTTTTTGGAAIPVELVLVLPPSYPTGTTLTVGASLGRHSGTTTSADRRSAMDALPELLRACRSAAVSDNAVGSESVFLVLSRAEEWIEDEWPGFCRRLKPAPRASSSSSSLSPATKNTATVPTPRIVAWGRKLIYSHHIIAKTKRRAISDLAKDYRLGGYFKIGWPGIIVLEGLEENCNAFYDEIRKMRWQHLVLRGEEREEVIVENNNNGDLEGALRDLRRFPMAMTELGEDQMSKLSELCKEAGLEDLFLTSMKIYKQQDENSNNNNNNEGGPADHDRQSYGTLVLVDHMNDPKGYTKWIHKACKSAGCTGTILTGSSSGNEDRGRSAAGSRTKPPPRGKNKPIIVVGLIGNDESSVKRVLKRWRTSRVDVDARGNPCLERMMDVLAEGTLLPESPPPSSLPAKQKPTEDHQRDKSPTTVSELESCLEAMGGAAWKEAFRDAIANRQNRGSGGNPKRHGRG